MDSVYSDTDYLLLKKQYKKQLEPKFIGNNKKIEPKFIGNNKKKK
jgi:hypothetical protein